MVIHDEGGRFGRRLEELQVGDIYQRGERGLTLRRRFLVSLRPAAPLTDRS